MVSYSLGSMYFSGGNVFERMWRANYESVQSMIERDAFFDTIQSLEDVLSGAKGLTPTPLPRERGFVPFSENVYSKLVVEGLR